MYSDHLWPVLCANATCCLRVRCGGDAFVHGTHKSGADKALDDMDLPITARRMTLTLHGSYCT